MNRRLPNLIVHVDPGGPRVHAKSAEVSFTWEERALQISARFGSRPPGVLCPYAVLALPFDNTRFAIVQVADGPSEVGTIPILQFYFLLFDHAVYRLLGDPFAIADRYPPPWGCLPSVPLPDLEWPEAYLPPRQVEALAERLALCDRPLVLGATQAMTDGASIAIVRQTPQNELCRDLWQFLPEHARAELSVASFSFSEELSCNFMVLATAPIAWPRFILQDEQTRDYPLGRYEQALRHAIETKNQGEFETLVARRSGADMLRLAGSMVLIALVFALVNKLFL